jgi:hypothetical protein
MNFIYCAFQSIYIYKKNNFRKKNKPYKEMRCLDLRDWARTPSKIEKKPDV